MSTGIVPGGNALLYAMVGENAPRRTGESFCRRKLMALEVAFCFGLMRGSFLNLVKAQSSFTQQPRLKGSNCKFRVFKWFIRRLSCCKRKVEVKVDAAQWLSSEDIYAVTQ